jgi:hypothetical protein
MFHEVLFPASLQPALPAALGAHAHAFKEARVQ